MKEKIKNLFKKGWFRDTIIILSFILFYLLIVLLITKNGTYIFGSKTDFSMQHYTLPEYFRTLFYENHDLFPDFAFNLGGGVNIYYFSYYGLFNPIILLSYLFPFVSMLDYIMVSTSICILSAVILFYFYLKKIGYKRNIAFLCSIMFLCASPLIFHSHRHIMFVNYFPFLIMGMYGIDRYIKKKKSDLLIISLFLMILTSYYFSVSAVVALYIYGLYRYIKENDFKGIIKFATLFACLFLIAILMSSILLIPTLYTLLSGRSSTTNTISILSLLKPNMYMLYDRYSMGLSIVPLIGTIYLLFFGKKENKLLSFVILCFSIFPIFNYILNGTLYINAKSLIPFIPIVLVNTAVFLEKIFNKKVLKYILSLYIIITVSFIAIKVNYKDSLITSESVNEEFFKNYSKYISALNSSYLYRINSSLIDSTYINKVGSATELKTTMYSSSYNNNYNLAYKDLFNNPLSYRNKFMLSSSNNPLFQIFMGEKYIFTKDNYDSFYEKVTSYDDINLYQNNYSLPIFYATSSYINESDFDNLEYPENIINMLGSVVNNETTNKELIGVAASEVDYVITDIEKINFTESDTGYIVNSYGDGNLKIKINDDIDNKLLIISFDILENTTCDSKDQVITINNVTNKLTCKEWKYNNENTNFSYVLTDIPDNILDISFVDGYYDIANIKVSVVSIDTITDLNDNIYPLVIDTNTTGGDVISGSVSVLEDAYFTASIPYDEGFSVYVDDKKIEIEKVNKYFIGFPISKGEHTITIEYHAPYKNISLVLSLIGCIIYVGIIVLERKKK